MPTIFSRKKSVSKRAGASKGLEKNNGIGGGGGGYPATYPASPASGTGYPIDEYGRPIVGGGQPIQAAVPAFSTTSLVAGPYGGAPPHGSTLSKKDFANMQNSLGGDYGRMSVDDRSVVEGGVGGAEEMALLYGYWGVETERELSPERVEEVVRVCSAEIMRRGLDMPLIFSTLALDISADGITSLIKGYVAAGGGPQWSSSRDIQFANPHDLAGMIKWALGRVGGGPAGRGFLGWAVYENWRRGEQAAGYPPRHIATHLFPYIHPPYAKLLSTLFNLLSSTAAYSLKNGMPIRKLATIFSSYIFGLPDDAPFDTTYASFLRYSHATEHLLLAFIRNQQAESGRLPTRLLTFINDYPQSLAKDLNRPSPLAKVHEVYRLKKLTRFYSKNLIQSAGTWDVHNSHTWPRLLPSNPTPSVSVVSSGASSNTLVQQTPVFAPTYKHLLNIRGEDDDEAGLDGLERFKSVVEKEWSGFMDKGFSVPDGKKLEFDLTEGERAERKQKHQTMDWNTFASSGFGGRETYIQSDLEFDRNLLHSVNTWPDDKRELNHKLRKVEKALPPFPYDIEPREERPILVDEQFFEAWADVLVASGWSRDEIKESSWVLIQWKMRPSEPTSAAIESLGGGDGRTEDRWFLIEEHVPKEYRDDLVDGKKAKANKRISFLRTVRRKKKDPPKDQGISSQNPLARTTSRGISSPKMIDDSVFNPGYGGGTKMLSLSADRQPRLSTQAPSIAPSSAGTVGHSAATAYAPSFHGGAIPEGDEYPEIPDGQRTPRSPHNFQGVGGTLTSQQPDGSEFGRSPDRPGGFTSLRPKKTWRKQPPSASSSPFIYETRSVDALTGEGNGFNGHNGMGHPSHRRNQSKDDSWVDVLVKDEGRMTNQDFVASSSATPAYLSHGAVPPDSAGAGSTFSVASGYPEPHPHSAGLPEDDNDLPPPPPPKHNVEAAYQDDDRTAEDYEATEEGNTVEGTAESDPYGGIEEGEVYRGSQYVHPIPAISAPPVEDPPSIPSSPSADEVQQPRHQRQAPPGRLSTLAARIPDNKHESLPPSPKPDADVPQDAADRKSKFASGMSHTSRVSTLIEMYRERDRQRASAMSQYSQQPSDRDSIIPPVPRVPGSHIPVRLSNFAFGVGDNEGRGSSDSNGFPQNARPLSEVAEGHS